MSASSDRRHYDRAIESGERNRETLTLIRNWCARARIQKAGGTGLIEQATGFPIGPHYMVCDLAPAPGWASPDLAGAAVTFYDRQCSTCTQRQPVALPNLSSLVEKRDRARYRAQIQREELEREAEAARVRRRESRDALRAGRSAPVITLLDDLAELDATSGEPVAKRIIELAQLAPEVFEPALVDHLYALVDADEPMFVEAGLEVLTRLGSDQPRLAAAAARCLGRHSGTRTAALVAEATIEFAQEELMKAAVPALAIWAQESVSHFPSSEREVLPGPLAAVYGRFPEVVRIAIGELLDDRRPYQITIGAGAVAALADIDHGFPSHFVRALATKLARAHLLVDFKGEFHEEETLFSRLQRALGMAIAVNPLETDALVQTFIDGASREGEARLIGVYERFLRSIDSRFHPLRDNLHVDALSTVVARLLRTATTSSDADILQTIGDAFRHPSDRLLASSKSMIDTLLGSAALMDARLVEFDAADTLVPTQGVFDHLDRRNRRSRLSNIKESLCRLSAEASAGDPQATSAYLAFLEKIDENHPGLRAGLVAQLHLLMKTPEGMNAALPALYSAMLGTSALIRARASDTIGELRSRRADDLPGLVFEAFLSMLTDQFVIVHRAAVNAASRIRLPERFKRRIAYCTRNLIQAYSGETDYDKQQFLMECIGLWAEDLMTDSIEDRRFAEICVALMAKSDPAIVASGLSHVGRAFQDIPGYVELLLRLLSDAAHHSQDNILRQFQRLPSQIIFENRQAIEKVRLSEARDHDAVATLVEVLTKAGAWAEATRVSEGFHDHIVATVPFQQTKWQSYLELIAVRFEAAIAAQDDLAMTSLRAEWSRTVTQIENDRAEHAKRSDSYENLPFSFDGGGDA